MGHAVAGHCAQHDRTAEIGRNVLRSISPLPAETGTSRARCQDHIHVAYEYLQGRRLQHASEQPGPGLIVLAVK